MPYFHFSIVFSVEHFFRHAKQPRHYIRILIEPIRCERQRAHMPRRNPEGLSFLFVAIRFFVISPIYFSRFHSFSQRHKIIRRAGRVDHYDANARNIRGHRISLPLIILAQLFIWIRRLKFYFFRRAHARRSLRCFRFPTCFDSPHPVIRDSI